MKIYFPYAGVEMPSIVMSDAGREFGFNVDIEHLGRPRLRKAESSVIGIPHQAYNVRLFPISDRYRKFSDSGRRINGVCWHGHYLFMAAVFRSNPMVTIRSAIATYNGRQDFFRKTAQGDTSDRDFNRRSTCNC